MKLLDEDAAIKAVRKALSEYNGEYDCRSRYGVIADAIENLKELPPAQPEHKVGKWIKDKSWSEGAGMGESYGHYWKCNQCNNIVRGDWSQCRDNFCSECGADMRGEEHETD